MDQPARGRIVAAEVVDPQNRNPKVRPIVILTPTDNIKSDEPFFGVAITGTLPNPISSEFVPLPFDPSGRSRTGLKKKCAARCDWLVELRIENIDHYIGWVPNAELAEILKTVESLRKTQ